MVLRMTNFHLDYVRLRKDNHSKKRSNDPDKRVIEFTSNPIKVSPVPPKGKMDALKPTQQEILHKLEIKPNASQVWGVQTVEDGHRPPALRPSHQ
jgi:hypothetical protein